MNLPQAPELRKKIVGALQEAERIMFLQDANKEALKDIATRIKDETEIKPAVFNGWVKVWYDEAKAHEELANAEEKIGEVEILKGIKDIQ